LRSVPLRERERALGYCASGCWPENLPSLKSMTISKSRAARAKAISHTLRDSNNIHGSTKTATRIWVCFVPTKRWSWRTFMLAQKIALEIDEVSALGQLLNRSSDLGTEAFKERFEG